MSTGFGVFFVSDGREFFGGRGANFYRRENVGACLWRQNGRAYFSGLRTNVPWSSTIVVVMLESGFHTIESLKYGLNSK